MLKLFCKLGWHCWHVSPNGMVRMCGNCGVMEYNHGVPCDPIKWWKREEPPRDHLWHWSRMDAFGRNVPVEQRVDL